MKIAYAGFDLLYPALNALVDDGQEIIKIFSCKTDNVTEFNTKVTQVANGLNIPITYDRITVDDLEELKNQGCDLLLSAGYYYRIPVDDELKMVNIHPALLPVGRGAWPMPVTIMKGMRESGVTFHKIEESFDTGDILMQKAFSVADNEDLVSFMQKVYDCLPGMIKELCSNFDFYYNNAVEQEKGEYWECPDEKDYVITEQTTVKEADVILRAFRGYECLYKKEDKTFVLINGKAVEGNDSKQMFLLNGGYIQTDMVREM